MGMFIVLLRKLFTNPRIERQGRLHHSSLSLYGNLEPPVLLRRQVDVLAAPTPRPNVVVEPVEGGVFGGTPRHEAAESL